jgi:hypothetical protein
MVRKDQNTYIGFSGRIKKGEALEPERRNVRLVAFRER